MKKILITGANSYIGTSFENYIMKNYPEDYVIDTVDMIDGSWREKDFSEYDVVFHVAGIAHQKETKENANLYFKVNYELAAEVAEKSKNDGVGQFIFLSSMSVYGSNTGVITKDSLLKPKTNYGKSKLMAEEAILKHSSETFCVAVIRPPMVYGPLCRGNFNSLVSFTNKLPAFPKIYNKRSMIYVDNLSEFVKISIDKKLCGIFMPQNKVYVCTLDFAKWISEVQGKKFRKSRLLGLLVRLIMPFVGAAKKAFGSLVYHNELEEFGFSYCVAETEESVKKSVVREEKSCEG